MTSLERTEPITADPSPPIASRSRLSASFRARMMRPIVVVVMSVFLVFGLSGLFGVQSASREAITVDYVTELRELEQQILSTYEDVFQELRLIADSDPARAFTSSTLTDVSSDSDIDGSQARLLQAFDRAISYHPNEILAVRYVTFTGAVWTEITVQDGIRRTDLQVRPNELNDDPTLLAALGATTGDVVASGLRFASVRTEPAGGRFVPFIRFATPVFIETSITDTAGVIQIDFVADAIFERITTAGAGLTNTLPNRRLVVVDDAGYVLFDSGSPTTNYLRNLSNRVGVTFERHLPNLTTVFGTTTFTPVNVDLGEGTDVLYSARRLELAPNAATAWQLLIVDDRGPDAAYLQGLGVVLLGVSLGLGALICLVISAILGRTIKPVEGLEVAALSAISGGTPSAIVANRRPRTSDSTRNPFSPVVDAFGAMTNRIEVLRDEMIAQQSRYDRNLDITARVGRDTAALHETDDLLNGAINTICDEFGFYHAQVFRVDNAAVNAVLFYSRGEVGDELLRRNIRIPVGSPSIIGQVAATGQYILKNDVNESDSSFIQHPETRFQEILLPETRAELVMPLIVGSRIIGVLDMQSRRPNSFHADDIPTLQILADQIAGAMENARLLIETELRFSQIDSLNQQLTNVNWDDPEDRAGLPNIYRYNLLDIDKPQTDTPAASYDLSLPITIRGSLIGTLNAEAPEGINFTEGDEALMRAVADRVGIAIENARLFQSTQASLYETSSLYQLVRALNEATTLEDVLQSIVTSVMPDAVSAQVGVFDDYDPAVGPDWLEMLADWVKSDEVDRSVNMTGLQLYLEDHPLLQHMRANQVLLVNDVVRDNRMDEVLSAMVQTAGGKSMVAIPFTVRGTWRGMIMVQFPEVREFGERDGRIYTALTDQAGVVIDNRLLLRDNERALKQSERLYTSSRLLNMAQSPQDLVRAIVSGEKDPDREYALGLFEGDLDASGWSTRLRVVAYSQGQTIITTESVHDLSIASESALRIREPQIIVVRGGDDTSSMMRFIRERGQRFAAVFPLFSANQPIALFFVTSSQPREDLSSEDYDAYKALTGQMSTVLQNRRLLEQTAQTLDETRRLYAASRAVASALDTQAVYEAAARHLFVALTPYTRFSVLRSNTPTHNAAFVEYRYLNVRENKHTSDLTYETRIPASMVPFGAMFLDTRSVLFTQPADYAEWQAEALQSIIQRSGSRSAAALSLQSRQQWFGVLLIESDQPDGFDEGYLNYAQAVVDQISIALESLQSFQEAQIQAKRALALAEAGQLSSRIGGEFERSLGEVFRRVADAAEYDRWILMLYDPVSNGLKRVIEVEAGSNVVESESQVILPLDLQGIPIVDAFSMGRMLLVNDPRQYPNMPARFPGRSDMFTYIGKHLAIPIYVGDQVVGALGLGRSLQAPDLDENDEQLGKTLAAQVGVAVENRRLFFTAENERQNLRSILETLPAGVLVLDAETYLPIQFNQQIVTLLGRDIDLETPFTSEAYQLTQSKTDLSYPAVAMPIFTSKTTGKLAVSDDVQIQNGDLQTDLLINAVPITDGRGNITAIVAAFQDISTVRKLEREVQENLEETLALYDTSRALSEGSTIDDLLDQVMLRLQYLQPAPDNAFILMLDTDGDGVRVARANANPSEAYDLPGEILQARDSFITGDVSTAGDLTEPVRRALIQKHVHALASLPLLARSRAEAPIGWLVVVYNEVNDVVTRSEQFLSALADAASVAIDNRNLFRDTQLALGEANNLYTASTLISRVSDVTELGAAMRKAVETLKPDVYAAYLFGTEAFPDDIIELFNVNLDDAPLPFSSMIERHNLRGDQTLYIDDLRTVETPSAFEQELLEVGSVRALALVQIRARTRPAGCIVIGYHRPRRFNESAARYLSALTDSASVIVANLTLLTQISSNLEETRILYQASKALNDAATSDDIIGVAITHLLDRPISLSFVTMLMTRTWEETNAMVRVAASWNDPNEDTIDLNGITLNAEQFPAWRLLATQEVLTIDDITAETSLDMMEQAGVESIGLRSAAFIPLRAAGSPIGVVVVGSKQAYRHTERDKRIYRAFSEQASLRLEATRLLAQAQRRARQLAISSQVSQSASSILDLAYLLPKIVDQILQAFDYDHVQVFLMDAEDRYAVLRASTGEAGRQLLGINHKLERGSVSVIGQVTETGKPSIASDTADARVVHRPNPYLPNTRSEMALPLILQDRVVGALDVQSNEPNAFDDDDLQVLTTLAGQISVAIDNARLYEDSQRRVNETSFLFNATSQAAGAETLDEALNSVSDELRDQLNALTVSIYLPRASEDEEGVTHLQPMAIRGGDMPLSELTDVRLDAQDNLLATAAVVRRAFMLNSIEDDPRYEPINTDAQSAIIVPLVAGAQLVGLVTAESALPNAYNDDTLTLLLTFAGSLSAIVQSQQLLEQVQRQNDQLRELDRLKSDFLANMSHELRTPLNSIIGFSRVILKGIDGPLTEMQEQDLSTIYNSGLHLLNLINDILDQAKIAAGKMDLQFDYFEVKSVIDGVRSIGIGLVKDKPIDIHVQIASGLPKGYGDEFRTRQVLLNLVSNAAKFTRQGAITIEVYTVERTPGNRQIRVDVIDTGIGIADKDIPLLFEEFRQVDSSLTRTQGGTGLGLPIAKSLIEMQGGEMVVRSTVNVGSTFSIFIPTEPIIVTSADSGSPKKSTGKLAKTAPLDPSAVASLNLQTNGDETEERPSLKPLLDTSEAPLMRPPMHIKRQILVIEDNPEMVDQYRRVLQREGFDIFAASIPLEAEAMASGLHPTLIVMDPNFAGGQGWDMIARLKGRDDTRDIPVVAVSLSDEEARARELGVFTFVRRPFLPEQLTEAILAAEQDSRVDRILIIDDQPESVRVLEDLLQEQGHFRVFSANNAMDGISLVARRHPNLVIVDLRMPDMDGFDVISELRGNPETASIPIIVVTGDVLNPTEQKALERYSILYKADINAGQRTQFMEGVKTHLTRPGSGANGS